MALERADRFYPHNGLGNVDAQTNFRQLHTTGDPSNVSIFSKSNGAAVRFTFGPGTASTQTDPIAYQGRGWAVDPSRWGVTDARGRVRISAGGLVFPVHYQIQNSALAASTTYYPRVSMWKYDTATNTATFVTQAAGNNATSNGGQDLSVTLANDVVFSPTEILYLQFGGDITVGAGLLGASNTGSVHLVPASGVWFNFDATRTAKQYVHYTESGRAVSAGLVRRSARLTKHLSRTARSTASYRRTWQSFTLRARSGSVPFLRPRTIVTMQPVVVSGRSIDGLTLVAKLPLRTLAAGSGRRATLTRKQTSVMAGGSGTMRRAWTAVRLFTAAVTGVPVQFRRVVVFVRTYLGRAAVRPKGRIELDLDDLPETGEVAVLTRSPDLVFVRGRSHVKISDPDIYA